ncbi:LamG-like jellyroll fold domain-containing protein [Bacteroidota bacterium]
MLIGICRSQSDSTLVAWWHFDDSTANDHSGNGYHGTLMNTPVPIPGVNNQGTAFEFQGNGVNTPNGDHIILPFIDFSNYSEFTIMLWVKFYSTTCESGEAYIWFGDHTTGWLGIINHVRQPENDGILYVQFSVGSDLNYEQQIKPLEILLDQSHRNQWVHYTLTYEDSTIKAYINGTLAGTKIQNIHVVGNKSGLARHWWNGNTTSTRFNGALDDVRIYAKDLTNNSIITENLIDYIYCAGDLIDIPFSIEGSFNSANKFIAQLSDAYGSFSNPVHLDALAGTNADTIKNAKLPNSMSFGTGYRIRVISTDPVFIGSDNGVDITINSLPTPIITSGDIISVCENNINEYESNTDADLDYQWSVTGGIIQGAGNQSTVSVLWGDAGIGSIKLVQENSQTGCKDSIEISNITINPSPEPAIISEDTISVCANNIYEYECNTGTGINYQWSVIGGSIQGAGNQSTVSVLWSNAGTGSIKLVQENNQTGCKDSIEKEVTIHPLPEITFDELPDICLKAQPLILNQASPKGGHYSGTGIISNIFYPQDADTGSHKITYTFISEYGCENSESQFIRVLPAPEKPVISQTGRRLISSSVEGNQWFIGGNEIPGANNQYYAPDTSGYYTLQITATNGCKSDLSEPYYFDITPVEENNVKKQTLRIYPNPATNQLFIEYYVDTPGNVSLVLYDILGNKVTLIENRYKLEGMFTLQINIDDFSSGLYYLVYQLNDKTTISKISVIK